MARILPRKEPKRIGICRGIDINKCKPKNLRYDPTGECLWCGSPSDEPFCQEFVTRNNSIVMVGFEEGFKRVKEIPLTSKKDTERLELHGIPKSLAKKQIGKKVAKQIRSLKRQGYEMVPICQLSLEAVERIKQREGIPPEDLIRPKQKYYIVDKEPIPDYEDRVAEYKKFIEGLKKK